MHPIKNIINNAILSRGEGKSILLIHDNESDYLKSFAHLHQHRFYLSPNMKVSGWDNSPLPHNFSIVRGVGQINKLDLIVCCNRGEAFDEAKKISMSQHVPLVLVDFCGMKTMSPHPFSSKLTENNPNHYASRNADVYVSIHESIEQSWIASSNGLSMVIPPVLEPPMHKHVKQPKFTIALEPFPKPYFDSLNIRVAPNTQITTSLSGADIFLNLWTSVTTSVLEAMALGVPVIMMKSEDEYIKYLSDRQCCIVVNGIEDIRGDGFVQEILQLHDKYEMKKKADEEIFSDPIQFASDWNSVIDYSTNKCYLRN